MKAFIVFSAIIATCAANSFLIREQPFIGIRRHQHDIHHSGHYNVHSEGDDGTVFAESGLIGGSKTGHFSYMSPEGIPISTSYVADEGGFRATGSHLPVPPPMPEAIRQMLPTLPKLIETHHEILTPLPPPTFIRRAPVLVHDDRAFLAPSPILVQEPAPLKTFVHTGEFLMDSSPSRTSVRIGTF